MTDTDLTLEDLVSHDRWLRALARRLVADEASAEDLAQETWAAAIERPTAASPTRAWFAAVLRNLHAMRLRTDERRTRRERAAAREESLLSVAELWDREQTRRRVAEAVFALEEPYRSAILHRYFQDLAPREIAARLDLSSAAVETRLRRGREQLRDRLDRDFGRRATWCSALLPLAGLESAAGAGAGALGAPLIGALAMGTKLKIAAVIVVATCVAVAFWLDKEPPEPLPPATTDARQETPDAPPAEKAAPEKATTTVSAEPTKGPAPAPAAVENEAAPAREPATASITGTVRDESGRPIEGALLRLVYRDPDEDPWSRPTWLEKTTRTDARGHYALTNLSTRLGAPSIYQLRLRAAAKGYGEEHERVRLGDRQDFILLVGGRIEGRVAALESGRPIAGAKVSASPSASRGRSSSAGRSVTADANGRFVIEGVRPDLYGLVAGAPGRLTDHRRRVHVEVRPRITTTLEITLSRGLTIRGRVLDATGRPIAGATVSGDGDATTDIEGRFEVGGAKAEARLHVAAPGKAGISQWVRFLDGESASGVAEREFRLLDPGILRGRIAGPDGVPVKDGAVRTKDSGPPTRADADGRFEVLINTPGKQHRMGVSAPGFASTLLSLPKVVAGKIRDGFLVEMSRGGAIEGRVLSASGAPIEGRTVIIKNWPEQMSRLDGIYRRAITGADGRYRFDALATGAYALTANGRNWPDRSGATEGRRNDVRVVEGSTTSGIDLIPPPPIRLTGQVLDLDDRPLAGVRVSASSSPGRVWSGADGRFTLHDIPARCHLRIRATKAEYSLVAKASRYPSHPASDSDEVILRMQRMLPGLRGRVVRADTGAPVTSFWVRLQQSSGSNPTTGALRFRASHNRTYFQDAGGAFFLNRNRRRIPYALDAGTDSGLVSARPTPVKPQGKVETVLPEIRLVPAGTVTGHVFAPDGSAIGRARVQATDPVDGRMLGDGWSFTHADGIYRLTGLPPGPVLLHVKHDDWYAIQTTIHARASLEIERDLRLNAEGARLQIAVRDGRGRPVAGAGFLLFSPAGKVVYWDSKKDSALYRARFLKQGRRSWSSQEYRHELVETAADGAVERRFLPPGDYVIQITHDGYQTARRPVTVRLNAANKVEIVLTPSK